MTHLSGLAERPSRAAFNQATGMPPLEYVHSLRLEEAKQMLEATGQPVEGIASEVGYDDAAFFPAPFRRKVGLTPVQYRRRFGSLRRTLTSVAQ
jgi:transcriptional regulator GlxA family with amidase domain